MVKDDHGGKDATASSRFFLKGTFLVQLLSQIHKSKNHKNNIRTPSR